VGSAGYFRVHVRQAMEAVVSGASYHRPPTLQAPAADERRAPRHKKGQRIAGPGVFACRGARGHPNALICRSL
jgi:hypothetical protein